MMNIAVYTNKECIANKRPFVTWYDGTPFCNGRGQRLDGVFIDMSLSREVIKDIIMPACYFAENNNIFILDEERDQFIRMAIDNVLKILQGVKNE